MEYNKSYHEEFQIQKLLTQLLLKCLYHVVTHTMKQMPILYRQDAMTEKLGSQDTWLKNWSLSFSKKIRLLTYIIWENPTKMTKLVKMGPPPLVSNKGKFSSQVSPKQRPFWYIIQNYVMHPWSNSISLFYFFFLYKHSTNAIFRQNQFNLYVPMYRIKRKTN